MNIKCNISILVLFSILPYAPHHLYAVPQDQDTARTSINRDYDDNDPEVDCDDCVTHLKIRSLCTKELKAFKARLKEICAKHIKALTICADEIQTTTLSAQDLCVSGASNITAQNLCVSGTANINEVCGTYRAFAEYSVNTTYTLGDLLNFDLVLDNPNGDLTTGPTSYTIPVSGYYVFTMAIHQTDLSPFNEAVLLGIPTASLTILVNGIERRSSFYPYLAFANEQQSLLSTVFFLSAGDVITATYNVIVVDQVLGLMPVAGTVTIEGGTGTSLFTIHYLSSTTCPDQVCTPCTPHTLPCHSIHCESSCGI